MADSSDAILRDATSAWAYLVECGGLDLKDRDDGFEERLLVCLQSDATSLKEALRHASLEVFLRAFFEAAGPYVRMFEAILRYFESAGATRGRQDWCLAFEGGAELGLDHFRTQLAQWHAIKGTTEVPAFDVSGAGQIRQILFTKGTGSGGDITIYSHKPDLPAWLEAWMRAYLHGDFRPLPRAALETDLPREFHPIIPFISAVAYRLAESGQPRDRLMQAWDRRRQPWSSGDALDPGSLAHLENDYYLRYRLHELYVGRTFDATEREAIGYAFGALVAGYPSRYLDIEVSLPQLEELLRLPLWQERNQLYAVWIATEVAGALDEHLVRLHHDHGRLEFGFKETALASVLSAVPPVTVYGERRSPLSPAAESSTRTEGVQPDYGVWKSGQSDVAACLLAVECKHYKQSAGRKFTEVLSDYALSLPNAKVYLVNYGPIGDVCAPLSQFLKSRCVTLRDLTPDNQQARSRLQKAVREAVGPPARALIDAGERSTAGGCVLILDISPSMTELLGSTAAAPLFELVKESGALGLVTADEQPRNFRDATEQGVEAALREHGSGTRLSPAVQALAPFYQRIIVVTDDEGIQTLAGVPFVAMQSWHPKIHVVEVRSTAGSN